MKNQHLTPAQRDTLALLVRHGEFECIPDYKPAVKLIQLGLAISEKIGYSRIRLTPTAAGSAANTVKL